MLFDFSYSDVLSALEVVDENAEEDMKGRRGWTKYEDTRILDFVHVHGKKWRMLALCMQNRSDDALRNRYNRLMGEHTTVPRMPRLSCALRSSWTEEEDSYLLRAVETRNRKWSKIGGELKRTPHACRNRYNRLMFGRNTHEEVASSYD